MCDLRALGMYKKTFTLNENKNMILGNGDQPVFFKVWSGIITGIVDSEKIPWRTHGHKFSFF